MGLITPEAASEVGRSASLEFKKMNWEGRDSDQRMKTYKVLLDVGQAMLERELALQRQNRHPRKTFSEILYV